MAHPQPDHEHAILVGWMISSRDGDFPWLPPEEAVRLAPHCRGCAWQVKVDEHFERRMARCW